MFKIEFANEVRRDLKRIPKNYQSAIRSALKEIQEDPHQGKPLIEELSGRLSFKVGVYRIIYVIDSKDKVVTVISAGHRSIIYK